MTAVLPALARLLTVAEEIAAQAATASRPGQMEELEAAAAVLREIHAELDERTEWGAKWSGGGYAPAVPPRSEEWARRHARTWGTKVICRQVGPWVFADTGEEVSW